jgi:hypothetical protein
VTAIDIDFEWSVGRCYECVVDEEAKLVVRQTSRQLDLKRPLQTFSELYLAFAKLDGSPEACLKFARLWGLLRQPAKLGASERLDDWKREINEMRHLVNAAGFVQMGGIRARMAKVDVELVSGEPGAFMRLHPATLFDAMIVQLVQSQASGASLQTCGQCGRWFEVGAAGKRKVAKFCSDRCRNRFHYVQRAQSVP